MKKTCGSCSEIPSLRERGTASANAQWRSDESAIEVGLRRQKDKPPGEALSPGGCSIISCVFSAYTDNLGSGRPRRFLSGNHLDPQTVYVKNIPQLPRSVKRYPSPHAVSS